MTAAKTVRRPRRPPTLDETPEQARRRIVRVIAADPVLTEWLRDLEAKAAATATAALRNRLSAAQTAASRCALEDHAGVLDELEALRAELADARAAVRDAYNAGHAAGVEYAAARQYVDGHLDPTTVAALELLPDVVVADLPLEPVVVDEPSS